MLFITISVCYDRVQMFEVFQNTFYRTVSRDRFKKENTKNEGWGVIPALLGALLYCCLTGQARSEQWNSLYPVKVQFSQHMQKLKGGTNCCLQHFHINNFELQNQYQEVKGILFKLPKPCLPCQQILIITSGTVVRLFWLRSRIRSCFKSNKPLGNSWSFIRLLTDRER